MMGNFIDLVSNIVSYDLIPETAFYKDGGRCYLGESDSAKLSICGYDKNGEWQRESLAYGEDGDYSAWIIRKGNGALVPEYYNLRHHFYKQCVILDDRLNSVLLLGKEIFIYRAGSMGTIIAVGNE